MTSNKLEVDFSYEVSYHCSLCGWFEYDRGEDESYTLHTDCPNCTLAPVPERWWRRLTHRWKRRHRSKEITFLADIWAADTHSTLDTASLLGQLAGGEENAAMKVGSVIHIPRMERLHDLQ